MLQDTKEVFIVESDPAIIRMYTAYIQRRVLGKQVVINSAVTLQEARHAWFNCGQNARTDVMIVDERLDRYRDALPFVQEVRQGFKGTIIATSAGGEELLRAFKEAGCDQISDKISAAIKTVELLNE